MKKLFLHIGTSKTGTTAFQWLCHLNRKKLLKYKVFYPWPIIYSGNSPKHQELLHATIKGSEEEIDKVVKTYLERVPQGFSPEKYLFSSEGFSFHVPEVGGNLKILKKVLHKYFEEIEVLVVFRDQVSFFDSTYRQCLKNPRVKNFPEHGTDLHPEEFLKHSRFDLLLNYEYVFELYEQIFGAGSVHALAYDVGVNRRLFGLLCGSSFYEKEIKTEPSLNESVSNYACLLLRTINSHVANGKKPELLKFLNIYFPKKGKEPLLLPSKVCEVIGSKYINHNEKLWDSDPNFLFLTEMKKYELCDWEVPQDLFVDCLEHLGKFLEPGCRNLQ